MQKGLLIMRNRLIGGLLVLSSFALLNLPAWSEGQNQKRSPQPAPVPPAQLKEPTTTISLPKGQVNISLVNQTGTAVTYQVLGDTEERRLPINTKQTLQRLPTPANMSFYRPDRGPIDATVRATAPGELQLIFKRGPNFDRDHTFLTVLDSGQVFLE
jgi:lipoprotein-anchoring transpeptidase ErfK/SrfK